MISKSKCPFCGSQVKIIKAHVTMFRCNNDECGAMVSFRGPVFTKPKTRNETLSAAANKRREVSPDEKNG